MADESIRHIDTSDDEITSMAEQGPVSCVFSNAEVSEPPSSLNIDRYGFIGGHQYTDPNKEFRVSIDVLRNREKKWMNMKNNWQYWSTTGRSKLRERCQKGIPDSMRCEAWQLLVKSPTVHEKQADAFLLGSPKLKPVNSSLFKNSIKLNGSRSLPTVISNSTNLLPKGQMDQDLMVAEECVKEASVQSANASMPQSSLGTFNRRKRNSRLKSLRKFGSFFRLNVPSSSSAANAELTPMTFSTPIGSPISPPAVHQRTYSAALPSATYLGLPVPSDSTTTSTGVSTDAYSLTTSSNFFSIEDTYSVQSLEATPDTMTDATTSSALGAGDVESDMALKLQTTFPNSTASSSSHLSTTSSCASGISSSPPLSLLGRATDNCEQNRDRTLVPPPPPPSSLNTTTASPITHAEAYYVYQHYVELPGDPLTNDQIQKDIHRQFPFHELFCDAKAHGRESLYNVLKAYTLRHPGKGYCQGQAPLAAVLLMFMPEADAFWSFTNICDNYLRGYYDEGLELIQIDGQVFFALLKRWSPSLYKFLMKMNVDPMVIALEWFMCVYTRALPWATVLRVLDMFFCEGKIVLFKVGLVLLHRCFGSSSFRKTCGGIDDVLVRVQEVPPRLNNPDELVRDILRLPLTQQQVVNEVSKQSKRWWARMESVAEGSTEK